MDSQRSSKNLRISQTSRVVSDDERIEFIDADDSDSPRGYQPPIQRYTKRVDYPFFFVVACSRWYQDANNFLQLWYWMENQRANRYALIWFEGRIGGIPAAAEWYTEPQAKIPGFSTIVIENSSSDFDEWATYIQDNNLIEMNKPTQIDQMTWYTREKRFFEMITPYIRDAVYYSENREEMVQQYTREYMNTIRERAQYVNNMLQHARAELEEIEKSIRMDLKMREQAWQHHENYPANPQLQNSFIAARAQVISLEAELEQSNGILAQGQKLAALRTAQVNDDETMWNWLQAPGMINSQGQKLTIDPVYGVTQVANEEVQTEQNLEEFANEPGFKLINFNNYLISIPRGLQVDKVITDKLWQEEPKFRVKFIVCSWKNSAFWYNVISMPDDISAGGVKVEEPTLVKVLFPLDGYTQYQSYQRRVEEPTPMDVDRALSIVKRISWKYIRAGLLTEYWPDISEKNQLMLKQMM